MVRSVLLGMLLIAAFALIATVRNDVWPSRMPADKARSPVLSDFRFRPGDEAQWSRADLDDRDWESIGLHGLPARDGIYWLRFRLEMPDQESVYPRDSFALAMVASYELFWDGALLGRNGVVGATPAEEQPGDLDHVFRIPPELAGPGAHVIALRISSHFTGFPNPTFGPVVRVFELRDYLKYRTRSAAFSLVTVGGALVVGIVFALMWLLADRRPAIALFSAACFAAATQQALQACRGLVDYSYDWHYPRLLAIAVIIGVLGVLLLAFLLSFFGAKRFWWQLALVVVLMAGVWTFFPHYGAKAVAICWWTIMMALFVALRAKRAGRRGAGIVLVGLVLSVGGLLGRPSEFLEHSFLFSSGTTMLGCVTAVVLQWRDERRAAQEAKLAAARLELELLKKNIQPHFLLNTLATLIEVIEQDPKAAVALIESLASEFRILARVSGERLIPLEQELELCRAHLRVMSLRKGARCELIAHGVEERDRVPPALFHTLVENGLTHLLPFDGRQDFALRAEHRAVATRYILLARGQKQPQAARGRPAGVSAKEGTGVRYIKSRLEESFTGRWSFDDGPVPEGWETVIEIRPAPTAAAVTEISLQPGAPLPAKGELG